MLVIETTPRLKRRINTWKDRRRWEIRKRQQVWFLRKCVEEGVMPKGLRVMKKGVEHTSLRFRELIRKAEKELLWVMIRRSREEIRRSEEVTERMRNRIEDDLTVFVREEVMISLKNWEGVFEEKVRERLQRKGESLGWKKEKKTEKKMVVILGEVRISEEEECFLRLGHRFKVREGRVEAEELIYSLEEAISDIKEEEVKEKTRRRAMAIVRDIMRKGGRGNLEKEEKEGLRRLKGRRDVVVEQADKGGAVVVMERQWYEERLKNLCDETYEVIGEKSMKEGLVEKVTEEARKKGMKRWVNAQGRVPVMKGFPKIHKEEIKLRPVMDCRSNYWEPIEGQLKLVCESIREGQESSRVRNTEGAREVLRSVKLGGQKTILFSLDVKAMFPSLKREAIVSVIEEEMGERSMNGWKAGKVKKALGLMWDNSFCVIGDSLVRIKQGLSIGSRLSPVLSEIVMNKWEEKVWKEGGDQLLMFCRYVDDCLGLWKGTRRQLEAFKSKLEDEEKGISLEMELEEEGRINYLDMTIEKKGGEMKTRWFQKECAAEVYCHKRSDVDKSTKRNFITNMVRRINMLEEEEEGRRKSVENFYEQLEKNGYNRKEIKEEEKRGEGGGRREGKKMAWD